MKHLPAKEINEILAQDIDPLAPGYDPEISFAIRELAKASETWEPTIRSIEAVARECGRVARRVQVIQNEGV